MKRMLTKDRPGSPEELRRIPLFSEAAAATLASLFAAMKVTVLRSRSTVPGSQFNDCVLVAWVGRAEFLSSSGEGAVSRVLQLEETEAAGLMAVVAQVAAPTGARVRAIEDCVILSFDGEAVRQALATDLALTSAALKRLARMALFFLSQANELRLAQAQMRLRATLVRLAQSDASGDSAAIDPAPSHGDLGTVIGASRETVTRQLNAMEREGLIVLRSRCIYIPNFPKFRADTAEALGWDVIDLLGRG